MLYILFTWKSIRELQNLITGFTFWFHLTHLRIQNWNLIVCHIGFPFSSVGKESACKVGDPGLIPGSGRSPGVGNGNHSDQHSCLGNPMDRGAWQATVYGVTRVRYDLVCHIKVTLMIEL